ncbi:MAG: MsnO8 family LLM class oxidoreductase [Corynebacterium sp.]|uniref:MsnO8 family LLM class oxidoreductase n=1 Tax=Corynebacterium sp. TaxID=1720 RepID=UPI0026DD4B20|nr:MsnO8 family LLM class oxidoreductase [Corynebacterium sp.]MDO4762015.1 MsnO8 family LLM class oxidoreductase [Corynebacterium sp.]
MPTPLRARVSPVDISLLDLGTIFEGETPADALKRSVNLAQYAEARGFRRIWYAEHHNSATIAATSPPVLIAHVAAHTHRISLGAGGVMLPHHSVQGVTDQFAMLNHLHPGRIELGVGRAPGGDVPHWDASSYDEDVKQLAQLVPVPVYVLGSSLHSAELAGGLGLPYAFASHFAPTLLHEALQRYRDVFRPSQRLDKPHAIASINIAENTDFHLPWMKSMNIHPTPITRAAVASQVFHYTAYEHAGIEAFLSHSGADEILCCPRATNAEQLIRVLDLCAQHG